MSMNTVPKEITVLIADENKECGENLVKAMRRLLWIDEKLATLTGVPISALQSDTIGDIVVSQGSIHDGNGIIDHEKRIFTFIRDRVGKTVSVIIYDPISRAYEKWKLSFWDNEVAISDYEVFRKEVRQLLGLPCEHEKQ